METYASFTANMQKYGITTFNVYSAIFNLSGQYMEYIPNPLAGCKSKDLMQDGIHA